MDNPLTPEQQNILIEDSLHTYPIVSMPRDITVDVIARIQTIPVPRPFQLTWNDLVLGIILSVCMGAIWFSLYHLPPIVIAQIRKESILLYQHILVNARWLIPTFSFGLAGFLSALTIPYLRKELIK
ncbi:MAG TPA: hypothetical protein VF896_02935 [Anaerolineales bacterium]